VQNKACKYCSSDNIVKDGKKHGRQVYQCKSCNHKFVDNDSFADMRTPANVISTAIDLYYDGLSLRKVRTAIAKIYRVNVSEVSIWKWIMKYAKLVNNFVKNFEPSLSGSFHHDETMINVRNGGARTLDGSLHQAWFWQTIDGRTRFLIATHVSSGRGQDEIIAQFRKVVDSAKQRPKAIFVDGSTTYDRGFNKVFYSKYKDKKVELVKRVGIQARLTNNVVERMHGTLKDRTKPMRGLKSKRSAEILLNGYAINYNYVRRHQALGITPAQAAGIQLKIDGWYDLIQKSTLAKTSDELQTITVTNLKQEARD
jgi:putative transposase